MLEIGCEEIPARMLPRAMESLKSLLEQEFSARGLLQGQSIQVLATPRRLAALARNLAEREQDRVEEIIGPPKSVAVDASGEATRAGEGFARKQRVSWKDLKEVTTPKGTYLAAIRKTKGRTTPGMLAELVPSVIRRIEFSRTMYWSSPDGLRFVRPIRWLVVLWSGNALKIQLDGLHSGAVSYGHRVLGNRPLKLRGADSYEALLRKAKVLASPAARRQKLEKEISRALRQQGLRLKADAELLSQVVNLVEHPSVVVGRFDARFLSLPEEVLVTVMRHHQKYFSVANRRGRLAPHFVAVIDQVGDRAGAIRKGHEAVLEARFRDAEFFWQADQELTLEDRRSLLAYVAFVTGAGNYAQKVARLEKLTAWLAQNAAQRCRRADQKRRHADNKNQADRRRADNKSAMRAA
ncbi:MAG: glycine--tRNA ligase subunit beta, partial [Terriglobia bacterium]